ncbi:hypothetical protein SBA6_1150013 [Candidatus Sulfopaludibacter sp. SbA6]|nr:hypothetical protein SBA6_1150013 [Candidatus Sulfopaludibacter sp. SbA6]
MPHREFSRRRDCCSPRRKTVHANIEKLVRRHDGELAPERRRAIDTHLPICEPCRLEHQRIGRALDAEREPVPARSLCAPPGG